MSISVFCMEWILPGRLMGLMEFTYWSLTYYIRFFFKVMNKRMGKHRTNYNQCLCPMSLACPHTGEAWTYSTSTIHIEDTSA